MKTIKHFKQIIGYYSFIAILLAFTIGFTVSCTEKEPIVIPNSTGVSVSATDDYVGRYIVERDDCGLLSPYLQIDPHYPYRMVDDYHQTNMVIYLTTFMNADNVPIEAEWDGVAFQVNPQKVMMGNEIRGFNARISEENDILTISYQLSDSHESKRCNATFKKTF